MIFTSFQTQIDDAAELQAAGILMKIVIFTTFHTEFDDAPESKDTGNLTKIINFLQLFKLILMTLPSSKIQAIWRIVLIFITHQTEFDDAPKLQDAGILMRIVIFTPFHNEFDDAPEL